MTGAPRRKALEDAARSRGVMTTYVDATGTTRRVGSEALAGVLAALGTPEPAAPDRSATSAGVSGRAGTADRAGGALPPVVVAWGGRLPSPWRSLVVRAGDGPAGGRLQFGYHEASLPGSDARTTVIAAPRACPGPPGDGGGWGVFAPAYGLTDERRLLAGDLTALGRLGGIAAGHGAQLVATLPLLAEHSRDDGAPPGQRPYSPLSRLWWNEAYLDLRRLPELAGTRFPDAVVPPGTARAAPPAGGDPSGSARLADLARLADVARPYLAEAAGRLEAAPSGRRSEFRAFRVARPDLASYACFRAAVEVAGPDPSRWPARWRHGGTAPGELPEQVVLRHAYAQFAMDRQLAGIADELARRDAGLLLDLPIGCRPDGFDPWAHPRAFATAATIGAPPDDFFADGQDWGFPPLHPDTDRAGGYALFRASLAHNLRHAAALRIDHVLGLSRLWWIPQGSDPTGGAYVRYRRDELLAVTCLEAWAAGAHVVGEDLGTVEPGLRRALTSRGISGMRVAIFDTDHPLDGGAQVRRDPRSVKAAAAAHPAPGVAPVRPVVAYVDTHDTATFAAWLDGTEFDERAAVGHIPATDVAPQKERRAAERRRLVERLAAAGRLPGRLPNPPQGRLPGRMQGRLEGRLEAPHGGDVAAEPSRSSDTSAGLDAPAVLAALVEELGESAAALVVVNLEDLWGERAPQNVPGTHVQRPNFARLLTRSLDAVASDPGCSSILDRLGAARRRRAAALKSARLER